MRAEPEHHGLKGIVILEVVPVNRSVFFSRFEHLWGIGMAMILVHEVRGSANDQSVRRLELI